MSKQSVIFLVHQGFSFIEELIELSQRQGLNALVLSSKINNNSELRKEHLKKISYKFKMTDHPALTETVILNFVNEVKESGENPILCMTVWEGYRLFMANLNLKLGALDENIETLKLVLDKHTMREKLCELGLSKIKSKLVKIDELPVWNGKPLFLKPRSGLGSFGAFLWSGESLKGKLTNLIQEMNGDNDYAGIFEDKTEFVAEEVIAGVEYSFEVIVNNGDPTILALHEKLDLEHEYGSVLENACACPPIDLSKKNQQFGRTFIKEVIQGLDINFGCYHIEARFDGNNWEIIEINPRLGGAYIYQSTKWVSGKCLLKLWMDSLKGISEISTFKKEDEILKSSFFRVFFGHPGKTIKKLNYDQQILKPNAQKKMYSEGFMLPNSSREIFIGQALWLFDEYIEKKEMENLLVNSKKYLEVTYA